MGAVEVLEGAQEVLRRKGWCQGAPIDPAGRCCASAALWLAAGGTPGGEDCNASYLPEVAEARHWVDEVLKLRGQSPELSLARWNDAPGRTVAEVLDLLRQAEAAARADEAKRYHV